ncbi:MAG: DUF4433 domain-containing protein [Myxococcota bacterium]|nr:DUF4433 domain-containing protein [Myxococcota bacterium]
MPMPAELKIYHIVHVDRLSSIISDGQLWCDAEVARHSPTGTTIGMSNIKQRRLELQISSRPGLRVGDCVPFYFCPRSIMLYVIAKKNHHELDYKNGQTPIVHLEADLHQAVDWAEQHNQRWAFTLSNAGSTYFEDRCSLAQLNEINWDAVQAGDWRNCQEGKQAEFLVEYCFPWQLVERIGVLTRSTYDVVHAALAQASHMPKVEITSKWYY